MFLVGMISWWYGRGLGGQFGRIRDRLIATERFFSIGQLLSTLFSPFRQISAGSVRGSIAMQLRAFFDQTISRVIGAIVRMLTILAGGIVMVLQLLAELLILIVWVTLPLFPIAGFIMFAIGWVPAWT
jgi:hypothetical protein